MVEPGFEDFVAARRPALLRTAYLLTGNRHDAEDLVQATLLRVVPKWSAIAHHPEPYVRKVLVRESVHFRASGLEGSRIVTITPPGRIAADSRLTVS